MPTTREPCRVLIVEDHQDTRAMYATFLADRFDVALASSAEEALEAMRARAPDIVVTDLALPGIDGIELMQTIRRDQHLHDVPVICLSGYDGETHEARATSAGATRVLRKPCLPDTLVEAITQVLAQRSA